MNRHRDACGRCEAISTLVFGGMAFFLAREVMISDASLGSRALLMLCALASLAAAFRFRIQAMIRKRH